MKNIQFLFFALFLGVIPFTAAQANHQAIIEDAWIAEAPPIAKIRAGYLKLYNKGKHPIEIKSFSSPDFKDIELHQSVIVNGMVSMEEIEHLVIKSGQSIEFKPGGYHLMLFNPVHKLSAGDKVKIQIQLKDNMTTDFTAVVRKRGRDVHDNHDHQHHQH